MPAETTPPGKFERSPSLAPPPGPRVGRPLFAAIASACGLLLYAWADAVFATDSGLSPPRAVLARAQPAIDGARRALAQQDAEAVRRSVAQAVEALGPWAGVPEIPTRYHGPIDTDGFDQRAARDWWLREIDARLSGLVWHKNPHGDPRRMQAGLRGAAWPLDALARTAMLLPERHAALTTEARAGADWLLRLQHSSGVFPFPIGPGLRPRGKVGRIVARAVRDDPSIVVNDWIADDRMDGGLQFDTGLCGRALVSAWELTSDARYLEAARRAGDWAIARPLVLNWNYNAFSVGLLARLYSATGAARYLQAAIMKAKVGVLPGQLPNGRWFDAHNASAAYHNILLRELLELFRALPAQHEFRPVVRDALTRGLDLAAAETLAKGYAGTWTDNFARGLQWIGKNDRWRRALNVNLNASGRNGAPSPGFAIVAVLENAALEASSAAGSP